MHASVSFYKLKPGGCDEFVRRTKESYMDLVRDIAGWRGYELIPVAGDAVVTISYWDDESAIEPAVERIWPWRDANLADLIESGPDKGGIPLQIGPVVISERRLV